MTIQFRAHRALTIGIIVFLATLPAQAQDDDDENESLEEIVVTSQRQAFRGDTPLGDLPVAVQTLPAELLTDMGVTSLTEALDFAASIARQNDNGGSWDGFAVRGLAASENDPGGFLVNGFEGTRGYNGKRDTTNIERIEVLKGPGGALFGGGAPGGTVNLITKKPQFEREGHIKASFGRFNTKRIEGDYTDGLSDSAAFRIIGTYEESDGFRSTNPERLWITPSLSAKLSDRTSILYELEFTRQEFLFDRGLVSIDGDPLVLPPTRSFVDPISGPWIIDSTNHYLTLNHEFSDDWHVLVALGYRDSSREGFGANTELAASRQLLVVDGETVSRQLRYTDGSQDDLNSRIEFSGLLQTGGIEHHLLIGADQFTYESDTISGRWRPDPGDSTYSMNAFDPDYTIVPPATSQTGDTFTEQTSYGVYFQDLMYLTDNLKVLLGLRYDSFDTTTLNRLTDTVREHTGDDTNFRVGLVYDLNDFVTLYGSYAQGFRPLTGASFDGVPFDPEKTESSEIGGRFSNREGNLSGSVALFTATKDNILTADPINCCFSAQIGAAESRGLEIDLTGNLTDSVSMYLSYAYINAESVNSIINLDWGVEVPAGSRLINIPEHAASLSLRKRFNIGNGTGLAGVAVEYNSDMLGETVDPSYILPSYTLLNLYVNYEPNDSLQFSVNLDNVTDEHYIASSYHKWWSFPGMPRSYSVSMQYSF